MSLWNLLSSLLVVFIKLQKQLQKFTLIKKQNKCTFTSNILSKFFDAQKICFPTSY